MQCGFEFNYTTASQCLVAFSSPSGLLALDSLSYIIWAIRAIVVGVEEGAKDCIVPASPVDGGDDDDVDDDGDDGRGYLPPHQKLLRGSPSRVVAVSLLRACDLCKRETGMGCSGTIMALTNTTRPFGWGSVAKWKFVWE